jgi:hypothetical protein
MGKYLKNGGSYFPFKRLVIDVDARMFDKVDPEKLKQFFLVLNQRSIDSLEIRLPNLQQVTRELIADLNQFVVDKSKPIRTLIQFTAKKGMEGLPEAIALENTILKQRRAQTSKLPDDAVIPLPESVGRWAGNALQFLSEEEATKLHKRFFKKTFKDKASLEDCVAQFFYLTDTKFPGISLKDRQAILKVFLASSTQDSEIIKNMDRFYKKGSTAETIAALGEVLYMHGADGLAHCLKSLGDSLAAEEDRVPKPK